VIGFDAPDLLDEQMNRTAETALIGSPAEVAEGIRELVEIGVDLVVLHVSGDVGGPAYREVIAGIGAEVLPLVS
jgi:alkanesulfonate monooxygenase SsuD/methylene tetrahydromethanopterin reductase-like flavin-dependent oxidoreductase (luciferase family)